MSHVVSMRLQDDQLARLRRYARRLGKTPEEVSAMLVEEQLRASEFAFIEFRQSSVGRQAYMKGSRLAVWWVVNTAGKLGMNVETIANHFQKPVAWVKAALNYYEAFPSEIDQAIEDHNAATFEDLKRAVPNAEIMNVSLDDDE